MLLGSQVVTLTSFNEWHEGTQIEPAVSQSRGGECTARGVVCAQYELGYGDKYLKQTRRWVDALMRR